MKWFKAHLSAHFKGEAAPRALVQCIKHADKIVQIGLNAFITRLRIAVRYARSQSDWNAFENFLQQIKSI